MNKKSLTVQGKTIGYIAALALFVILFFLIKNMAEDTGKLTEKDICKRSVEMQKATKKSWTVLGSDFTDTFGRKTDIKCSTNYETIKDKNEEVIKFKIAKNMADCWDQFGKGEWEIFDTSDQNFCVVCSRLEFEEKKEITDFTKYLMEHDVPFKIGTNFYKYMTNIDVTDYVITELEKSDLGKIEKIDTQYPLGVLYVMAKNAYPNATLEAGKTVTTVVGANAGLFVGTIYGGAIIAGVGLCSTVIGCLAGAALIGVGAAAIGGGTGYVLGADRSSDWLPRVLLWNYDDVKDLHCTYIEGKAASLEVIKPQAQTINTGVT